MIDNKTPIWIGVLLLAAIFVAGCASPSAPAPVQTPAPTTVIQTSLPTTATTTPQITVALSGTTSTVTTAPAQTSAEKEILHEKGVLTTTTFKT